MLQKNRISSVKIHSDEWHQNRLAKFTSSEIHNLMGSGATAYIRRKVGEELTGKPAKGEIDTEATRWGSFYEAEAITKFGQSKGLTFLVVQQLVCEPNNGRFGGTPDAIIPIRESPDGTEWEVETVEVKCPPTFDGYLLLWECETAEDLKRAKKEYYWQVIDQMDICGCLVGYFVVYHPDFKAGNLKVLRIEAMSPTEIKGKKTYPIYEDLKALRLKKKEAEEQFDKLRSKLMAVPAV